MDTEKVESKNENPKKDAGFINKLFFGWMISLIRKRREINLELHDFYNVFDEDDSKVLGNRLQKNWKSEIVKSQQSKRKPSLLKAIVKTFLFEVMFYGIFWFFSNVLIRCTQPLILARLISLFGEEFNEKNTEKMYFYSTMLIVTSILTAFMSNHIELGLSAIGMRIRIACSSLLYRKMIRLDFKSLEVAAVDRVVDLLSNDVNRFDFVINSIHSFWTIPVQILVLTYFVWEQVGFSCLAGVATMIIITLTLQGFVSKLMGKLRSKISQRTDERLKLMTEIISGIQLIKINGWEKRFEALVDCARKKEMIAITAASYLRGVVSSCFVFLEKTALALTVICYVGSGHRITAEKVFSIAQAYGILHISLSVLLPEAMTRRSETSTSVERLRDFLLLDEKPHGAIEPMIKTGIIVTEVDASWTNQTKTLTDLSVQIPRGCLCAVIGPTGAGKSSLLHLLLGELAAKSGRIQLGGHVSYCSQEAWLSNSTVRGNITFGNPYDERCYDKIVKVCDLGVDFERLPRGDRTVCDERGGVSLSGGQRAKIHLARAVYKQADIYLLDDPLSAVDARVGKLLFEECILKYLKGKTRILVTRQLEHLKAADFVVVLNEGKIEATGTFRELCKSKIDFTEMLVKKNAKSEKYEKPTEIEVTTNFPSNKNFISKSKNKYYHGKSRLKPYNGEDVVNNGGVNEADIVKNKKDVVKHVEDVVNNGNIVKYKADIVKHENDAVKRKEDVVKQKEDVVKHVEDVVNNGNIVKYKADIVKHENDAVKRKEDVVKQKEDVVNNGNIVKYKADIVKHENDAVKRKEDVVKQKEDVVKHVEDVVNNGNIVKYKADIVKHENDAVKRKEDVVKQKEDVVNNGNIVKYKADIVKHENDAVKRKEDVVKQKEDVVKHVEDVVNNGNIVKYKADIVKHENDAVKRKEDVVKQKEDVVNNGIIVKYKADIVKHREDIVKHREDIVKHENDIVKQKEDVVNNGNIVKYKADIVKHREDIVKHENDIVKQKEDVVNNGNMVKYKADIVKHKIDVVNKSNMGKDKADLVKHREDIVKHKNDIVKQKEVIVNNGNVVKDKADIVKHREDIVKHREDIVKHKNDIVKQKEVVVNNGNMVEDKADIVKHEEDIVKCKEDVENSNDIVEDKADKVKHKEDIVKNKEDMANNGNIIKDKADIVKYEEDVVEDKEDIVKNKEDVANNGNIKKDKADVVKYEEDIVEDKEDIVKNKKDMANNGNIMKDNNDIVNNDEDGLLNDYNKNKGKNYLLKKYVLAAKRVEIAIVTLLLFLLTQILSSGVDLWVTFWTSQEELRHQNTSITLNVSSSMSRYHPEEYAVRVFYVNGKHSMGKYGYSYQETIPVLKTTASRASDGVFDTVEINGVAHNLVKTNLAAILYALLMIMVIVLTLVRSWLFFKVCMMSSVNMHKEMFDSLMEAPLEFFDTDFSVKTIDESSKDTGSTKEVMSKVSMTSQQTTFSNSSKPGSFSKESGSFNGVLSKVSMGSQQTTFSNSSKPGRFSKETGSFNGVLSKVSMGSQQTTFSNSRNPGSSSIETGSFNGVLSKVSMGSQQTTFSNSSKPGRFSKETGSFNGVLSKVSMGSQQTTFSNSSKPGRFSKESGSFNGVLSKVSMGSQQTTFSNSSKPGRFSKETGSFNGVLSKVSMGSQQTTFSNSSKPGRFSKESGSFNGVLSKVSMGSQQTTFSNSSKPGRFSKETGSFNGVLSKVSMGSQQTTFSNSSKPGRFSKETGSFNGVLSKVSMGSQQTTFSNSSKPGRFSKETGSFNGVLSKVSMGSQQTTFSNSSKPGRFSKETGSFNGVLSKVSMGSQQISNKSEEILNRFSKDTGSVDEVLPRVLMDSIQVMLTLGGIFVNLLYSNPYYIVATLLLGTVFVKFGNLYTSTAEIFKRLEKKTKSPMISHITSSINGIVTIRASKAESMLTDKFDVHQNLHTSASYLKISSVSAFGLWLDLICVIQLTVIILSFLILHKYTDVNGSLVGLAISQSMILGAALRYGLNRTAEAKNRLTSVEKVLQYTEIKNEKPSETEKEFFPPESWPGKGKIEFRNIFLKCSDDDLGVLRNINFTILPGEKIGIVGRTGAGKTSLISVLFRLVRFDGSVLIDDVDTKQIGREFIRKKISIIPREPILFSSTIRYNLDPYNEYNDEEMWKALEQVELSNCVSSLDLKVSDDGSNFNLGQKQLIYLARALLRNNKILILDEATANVDHRTDALIQATIRNRFKNCTVITIAHRLNTIMEYNKVMVMSDGKLVEIGHPHHLLDNNKGHFHKLVLETGPEMSSKLKEVAMMTYYEDYTHCFYIK
ncbi:uncharacterized protein LOC130891943 isoform X2 [Diorhabda carinulata]|uniref:uncharacterized protein LOC130891943 isoform X2 n=1 Tax=Diorhabda carinulata TaxID=1163345 RepID=UPI0025A19F81|nr:uncharacterized protein LOC130891943 isoform X2 [Diorhabda carinulata]